MAASYIYTEEEWSYEESDSDKNNSTESSVCELYESPTYMKIAMLAASMGVLSTLASVAVTLVIIIFKKYNIFIQRLILYLCITAALNSASIILRFSRAAGNPHDQTIKNLCVATAFIDQTTKWSLCIAYACLTINMLFTVVFNVSTQSIEMGYFIAIFLFPLTFNWIPFLQSSYGEAGAWCWIRSKNYADYTNVTLAIRNCSDHQFGEYLRYALWYIPHYAILCVMVLAYILIVVKLISNASRWKGLYSTEAIHQKEQMKELVKPIIFYPLVYFFLNLFPLINRSYETANGPSTVLWILHAGFSPLQGGFIALLYVLDRDTLHRLNPRELLAYLLHRKTPIQEYPVKEEITDSYKKLLPNGSNRDVKVEFIKETKYGSLIVSEKTLKGNKVESENGV